MNVPSNEVHMRTAWCGAICLYQYVLLVISIRQRSRAQIDIYICTTITTEGLVAWQSNARQITCGCIGTNLQVSEVQRAFCVDTQISSGNVSVMDCPALMM